MGYYVSLTSSTFGIPAENVPAAFESLKSLNGPQFDHLKVASSSKDERPHYLWMAPDWDETVKDIVELLWLLKIDAYASEDGSIHINNFDGKWSENIPLFLSVLAAYAEDGGYLEFRGEEPGDIWRLEVERGQLIEHRAIITWDRIGPVNINE